MMKHESGLTPPISRTLDLENGIQIHLRLWEPTSAPPQAQQRTYLLLHGLSSNARTWDQVAARLALAGQRAAAIDQRGHGLSAKPDTGYDFSTITEDLHGVLQALDWENLVLVGQSWGGNVLLEYAARHPGLARAYVFVDGGFLDLRARGPWEQSVVELRPPDLAGTPRSALADRIRQAHPAWSAAGIEATLGNFEILPDGTVQPWLSLEHHLRILRSMYEQDPGALFPKVEEPVLICAADEGGQEMARKQEQVKAAESGLQRAEVIWFKGAAHDIHVDQPESLAAAILAFED